MSVQNVKTKPAQPRLSWLQITLLVCGFWLIVLLGNTRNPLANYAAVSVYDVKTVTFSPHLAMQLLVGPLAGALGCLIVVTVIGGRQLWRQLAEPIPARRWWWLVPVSLVLCALRWGLTLLADQLPWTWLNSEVMSDLQWWHWGMIAVVGLREFLTVVATLLLVLTLYVALHAHLRPAWRWLLYLLLGIVAAGIATTSAQPTFLRNLLVAGIPAIASLLVFSRWHNLWFVVLSYELVWRLATVVFVLATW